MPGLRERPEVFLFHSDSDLSASDDTGIDQL